MLDDNKKPEDDEYEGLNLAIGVRIAVVIILLLVIIALSFYALINH